MKNYFLSILVLAILICSCKKESAIEKIQQHGTKHEIRFNVSNFKQTVEAMFLKQGRLMNSSSDDSLASHLGNLYYLVYDTDGTEMSRKGQLSNGETWRYTPDELYGISEGIQTFGSISDSLEAGKYTVVFVGAMTDISINNRSNDLLDLDFAPLTEASFYYTRGLDSWPRASDTFFKKFTLNVGDEDIEQDVVMNRIVGKLEIKIKDKIPSNAHSFRFRFYNENEAFLFNTETPFGSANGDEDVPQSNSMVILKDSEKGEPNFTFSKLFINTTTPITAIIDCFDDCGDLIATKTVNEVFLFKNKRTILSGNLFDTLSPQLFKIAVNVTWDSDSTVVNF